MASEATLAVEESPNRIWIDAAVAGVTAGVAMGVVMQYLLDDMPTVGGLYGVEAAPVGWATHLFHAVLFALAFAALGSTEELRGYAGSPVTGVGLGLAWAAVLWLVAASVLMPLWMGVVGIGTPDVPSVELMDGVAHAVYGVVLGCVFGFLRPR